MCCVCVCVCDLISYVLAEGFKNWVKTFNGKKDDHIDNFDRECWNEVCPSSSHFVHMYVASSTRLHFHFQVESELVHINDQPSPRDLAGH